MRDERMVQIAAIIGWRQGDGCASGTESLQTHRWREVDSNFQYAGALNLFVTPFVVPGCWDGSARGSG